MLPFNTGDSLIEVTAGAAWIVFLNPIGQHLIFRRATYPKAPFLL